MIQGPDNPVWEALTTVQEHFNSGTNDVRYFPPEVGPFIGMRSWDDEGLKALDSHMPEGRSFSVMIARQIQLPPSMNIVLSLPLYQMVSTEFISQDDNNLHPRLLAKDDIAQMLALTAATRPGPFLTRTIEFGNYLGLFQGETLIAMAGERLKTPGFTEVSAICTDPVHLGKGYASLLTAKVCEKIHEEGKTPFLHVRQDNTRAIEVYKKLGFQVRAEVYFAIFKKG